MAQSKKRLEPTPATLRSLYLASGGVCEMPECNKRLNRLNGAWIGTVAHIVSAEDNGPRADTSMSAEEKRGASNLMLLCADHGREIDDHLTGESTINSSPVGEKNFGREFRDCTLKIHESLIQNRELNAQHLRSALGELEQRRVVYPPSGDVYEYEDLKYEIDSPWSNELTTWRRIAEYLDRIHMSAVSSWVTDLDYSIFD